MIKRIVKMSFQPDKVEQFKQVYAANWNRIREFEGCRHVELLQGKKESNVFFTFSIWQSEQHLDQYRHSELFEQVWSATKVLFNDRPQAWSLDEVQF